MKGMERKEALYTKREGKKGRNKEKKLIEGKKKQQEEKTNAGKDRFRRVNGSTSSYQTGLWVIAAKHPEVVCPFSHLSSAYFQHELLCVEQQGGEPSGSKVESKDEEKKKIPTRQKASFVSKSMLISKLAISCLEEACGEEKKMSQAI